MKAISDSKLEMFEDVAIDGVKQIKAYFKYEGNSPTYMQKAKVGATTISAYARMRASETNRMQVELMTTKLIGGSPDEARLIASPKTAAK